MKAEIYHCDFCQDRKIVCSDDAEMSLVQITPLPGINLTTGETIPPEKPYMALCVSDDYGADQYFPVRFCPLCGRKL